MLKLNLSNLRENNSKLKELINSYEVTSKSIVHELKNLDTAWHDDNSGEFFSLVEEENKNIDKFILTLNDLTTRYSNVESKTLAVDGSINELFSDPNKKSTVMDRYNNAISDVNSLVNRMSSIYSSSYFCKSGERSSISSITSQLRSIASRLTESKDRVSSLFRELESLEQAILRELNGINITSMSDIDVSRFMSL